MKSGAREGASKLFNELKLRYPQLQLLLASQHVVEGIKVDIEELGHLAEQFIGRIAFGHENIDRRFYIPALGKATLGVIFEWKIHEPIPVMAALLTGTRYEGDSNLSLEKNSRLARSWNIHHELIKAIFRMP
jgi:hypothetical protein